LSHGIFKVVLIEFIASKFKRDNFIGERYILFVNFFIFFSFLFLNFKEICRIGTEEQNEWYFFSHKDKKYPTGTRTNRATAAGFWKATGRDKAIYSKHELIGMRKTLVFYKGRAPNGQKSDWIMHEYRLETDENGTPQASYNFSSHMLLNKLKLFPNIYLINYKCLYERYGILP